MASGPRFVATGPAYHNIRKAQAAEPPLPEVPVGEETPAAEATTATGG